MADQICNQQLRVWGLRFEVWGVGFTVERLGVRVSGL